MKVFGYNNVEIQGEKTNIVVVKSAEGLFYIWFENVKDVSFFKTTGYILKIIDKKWHLDPVNTGGILPANAEAVIKYLNNTNPDWVRES